MSILEGMEQARLRAANEHIRCAGLASDDPTRESKLSYFHGIMDGLKMAIEIVRSSGIEESAQIRTPRQQ